MVNLKKTVFIYSLKITFETEKFRCYLSNCPLTIELALEHLCQPSETTEPLYFSGLVMVFGFRK